MSPLIRLNDFKRQWQVIGPEVLRAVERVGAGGKYVLSGEVEAFELRLAESFGVAHAIGVASGLDALEISLRALGLRAGDRVLTTPLSAFATTLAVLRAGGVPEFVDVDENGLMDLELAERRLAEARGAIRFVLPVHLFGHCLDLGKLESLARACGARWVEDCAQSILASHEGRGGEGERLAGSVGAMAATSFYPTKNLGALGDGGAILTHDAELARTARRLRDYGQSEKYRHELVGMNSRLDELQAAILSASFPRLRAWTDRRRKIADRYRAGIVHAKLRIVARPAGSRSVEHLFPVLVTQGELRPGFIGHLTNCGVQTGIHYPILIPEQPALEGRGAVAGGFPRAKEFSEREVSLPIHPFLTDTEVEQIVSACNDWGG